MASANRFGELVLTGSHASVLDFQSCLPNARDPMSASLDGFFQLRMEIVVKPTHHPR